MTVLTTHRARAIGERVLRQLRADPRFVAVSLVIPLVIIFLDLRQSFSGDSAVLPLYVLLTDQLFAVTETTVC